MGRLVAERYAPYPGNGREDEAMLNLFYLFADVVFPGMRGTGDWTTDERDYSWLEGILRIYPNGKTPLMAVSAKLPHKIVEDPLFNWFYRVFPNVYSALEDDPLYTDTGSNAPDPTTALSGDTTAAGTLVWVNVGTSESEAKKYRQNQEIEIARSGYSYNKTRAQVTGRYYQGLSGTAIDGDWLFQVRLMQADPIERSVTAAGNGLDEVDYVFFGGGSHMEGSGAPPARVFDPSKQWNVCSIIKTTFGDFTGTALAQTSLRTGNRIQDARLQGLEWHAVDNEFQGIFGVRFAETDSDWSAKDGTYVDDTSHAANETDDGIRRRSAGLLYYMEQSGSGSVISDHTTDTTRGGGGDWTTTGETWLDTCSEEIFRYGNEDKMVLCGGGALLGLNRLVKAKGTWELTANKSWYGIDVFTWVTPFGRLHFKPSAVMTQNPVTNKWGLVLDTGFLERRFTKGRDMKLKENIQANDLDREKHMFLSEWGLQFAFPLAHGLLTNMGVDTPS